VVVRNFDLKRIVTAPYKTNFDIGRGCETCATLAGFGAVFPAGFPANISNRPDPRPHPAGRAFAS
jgi:hypothetical protein